jgi:hypothetical protein
VSDPDEETPKRASAEALPAQGDSPSVWQSPSVVNCEWGRALIDAYLVVALETGLSQDVRVHLETCEHCRAILEDYRRLNVELAGAPDKSLRDCLYSWDSWGKYVALRAEVAATRRDGDEKRRNHVVYALTRLRREGQREKNGESSQPKERERRDDAPQASSPGEGEILFQRIEAYPGGHPQERPLEDTPEVFETQLFEQIKALVAQELPEIDIRSFGFEHNRAGERVWLLEVVSASSSYKRVWSFVGRSGEFTNDDRGGLLAGVRKVCERYRAGKRENVRIRLGELKQQLPARDMSMEALVSRNPATMMSWLGLRIASVEQRENLAEAARMRQVYDAFLPYLPYVMGEEGAPPLPPGTTPQIMRLLVVSAGIPGVWATMDKGTRRYGDVLIGYYGKGLSTTELGRRMELTAGSAAKYVQRGLRRLRRLMIEAQRSQELPLETFDFKDEYSLAALEGTRGERQSVAGVESARRARWSERGRAGEFVLRRYIPDDSESKDEK